MIIDYFKSGKKIHREDENCINLSITALAVIVEFVENFPYERIYSLFIYI